MDNGCFGFSGSGSINTQCSAMISGGPDGWPLVPIATGMGLELAFMDLDLGLSDLDAGFPGSGSLVFLEWIDGFHG